MPTVKLSPILNDQVCDEIGAPAVGWKIYTYTAGSSTAQATYTSSAGDVPQPNPIVLDALGFSALGPIWLASGVLYKLVLTDENDVVKKTFDNIAGTNDSVATTNQWIASGTPPTYISGTSFSVPGDQTSEFHIGRREQFTAGAGTLYGTIITSVYNGTTITTVTVQMDSGALDNGLTVVNHSILRADNIGVPADVMNSIPLIMGLSGAPNSGTPTTKFDVTATRVSTIGPSGKVQTYMNPGAKTVDLSVQGIGGRDQVAAFGNFAEPNLFYVPDGAGSVGLILSLNSFATGPAGFTEWAPVMNQKLNGAAQFYQGDLKGDEYILRTPSTVVGGAGAPFPSTSSYQTYAPAGAATVIFSSTLVASSGGVSLSATMNLSDNTNAKQIAPVVANASSNVSQMISNAKFANLSARNVVLGYSLATGLSTWSQNVYLNGWTKGV